MQQHAASPLRVGTTCAAASPAHMNRLDRILELVTDHESNYRDQDIKLSEMSQKMAELEVRMTQELAPLWALKERNIPQELDLARTAVETVVRQLTAVTKANQMLQSELKACQQKQQQQAQQYESAISLLQADVAALRNRVDDSQQRTRTATDQLRTTVSLQLEQQSQQVQEQLQSMQRESSSQLELMRQDLEAKATSAAREVESWTKGELLGLTSKVKAVVAGCASHQQQVNVQMEALQQQWDNTSRAMEALQSEDKRLKKHVVRLQNQAEELQRLAQQAITSEVALQQMRNDIHQLTVGQQQLATRLEVSCNTSSSLLHKFDEADQQLSALSSTVAAQNTDLAHLAEAMAACLAAAREDAAIASAAAAAAGPSSYLSTLLAPAGAQAAAAAAAAAGSGTGLSQLGASGMGVNLAAHRKHTWSAWDNQLAEVDSLVGRLKKRMQLQSDVQVSARAPAAGTLTGSGSHVRRSAAAAGGGKYQLQLTSSSPQGAGSSAFYRR